MRRPLFLSTLFNDPALRGLGVVIVVIVANLLLSYAQLLGGSVYLLGVQLAIALAGLVVVLRLAATVRVGQVESLKSIGDWAERIGHGDLSARVPLPGRREFRGLASALNMLGERLQDLSQDVDGEVLQQAERLAQKTRSLEILYEVSARINVFTDLEALLSEFLDSLMQLVNAGGGAVRICTDSGGMRLVASRGEVPGSSADLSSATLKDCLLGRVVIEAEEGMATNLYPAGVYAGGQGDVITVPLDYHGETLGVYNLWLADPNPQADAELDALLTSIGRHVGVALDKVRVEQEAQRLSIVEERNRLAHELHDSLAQTLASLRFQIRLLEESLEEGSDNRPQRNVARLREGLEQANRELRGLLAYVRAPMNERGLVPTLEELVERFRADTGIVTFFQKECPGSELSADQDMQVVRIIQEALANIRKHSQAHAVRILFRCNREGDYRILVEDDGVGMEPASPEGDSADGRHLGMAILRERAERLGGQLSIESEPAEGTRLELSFRGSGV